MLILPIDTDAGAAPITYTESAVGSGTLNGVSFSDATITMTATGDTTGQFFLGFPINQYGNSLTSLTIDISGVGTATYNGPLNQIFAVANPGAVPNEGVGFGFSPPAHISEVVIDTIAAGLDGYQLVTAIGPVTGFGATESPTLPTNLGDFVLGSIDNNFSTFTATFPATVGAPGPVVGAGLPGLLAGFGAMLAWYRKRRAVAA